MLCKPVHNFITLQMRKKPYFRVMGKEEYSRSHERLL